MPTRATMDEYGMDPSAIDSMIPLVGPFAAGSVCLVGAGPGDATLLTIRGAVRLTQADTVLCDRLARVPPELICQADARIIKVGKSPGEITITQAQINVLMRDEARSGRRVVRLKGGDPFVFGRGGEECEFLASQGIPYEVVPGITAAMGTAASVGIPLTHRDWTSSVALVSGHENPTDGDSTVSFSALARMGTVAFYMSAGQLRTNCQALLDAGAPGETPAITIAWGTTSRERAVQGVLGDIADRVEAAGLTAPAMTIIGNVVALREKLAWKPRGPLAGRTVLITRPRERAAELTGLLVGAGAEVLHAPTIELKPPADTTAMDRALRSLSDYHWLVLTSATGVDSLIARMRGLKMDARNLARLRIAAVGPATAKQLERHLLRPDLIPDSFMTQSLAEALIRAGVDGQMVLLLRADIADRTLASTLERAGAMCHEVPAYCVVGARSLPEEVINTLRDKRVAWITATSPSTFLNLVALLGDEARALLAGTRLASIGPVTTRAIHDLGFTVHAEAAPHTATGLVEALSRYDSSSPAD